MPALTALSAADTGCEGFEEVARGRLEGYVMFDSQLHDCCCLRKRARRIELRRMLNSSQILYAWAVAIE